MLPKNSATVYLILAKATCAFSEKKNYYRYPLIVWHCYFCLHHGNRRGFAISPFPFFHSCATIIIIIKLYCHQRTRKILSFSSHSSHHKFRKQVIICNELGLLLYIILFLPLIFFRNVERTIVLPVECFVIGVFSEGFGISKRRS